MCVLSLLAGCRNKAVDRVQPANQAETDIFKEFQRRVDEYVALHRRIEADLPALPNEATPQQIDARQRDLLKRIAAARAGAKQGDLLTPAMQDLIRARFEQVFKEQKDGAAVRESVMDENPTGLSIGINDRYPDDVPLSTMPPDVLEFLPKMPEELEFRFVGRDLIIMDPHAHLIVDFVPNAIPE
jgi:hypothetical protein